MKNLFLGSDLGKVLEGFAALVLGVLNRTFFWLVGFLRMQFPNLLASASLEKLPVQVTKVCPSCLPEVTGYARIVETTEE